MTAAAQGLHVTPRGAGVYMVPYSGSCGGSGAAHVVTIDRDRAVCDCTDYRFRQRQCKHLGAVVHYLIIAPLASISEAGPGLEQRDVPPALDQADGSA